MNTFNFKIPLISIKGEPDPEQTLASVLSEILGSETEGKTLKLYDWYKTLQIQEPLTIDESDRDDLIRLIEKSTRLFIYVKGQLLEILKK